LACGQVLLNLKWRFEFKVLFRVIFPLLYNLAKSIATRQHA